MCVRTLVAAGCVVHGVYNAAAAAAMRRVLLKARGF